MIQVWIGIIGALIMAGGVGGLFYLITKKNMAVGIRSIQFLAITLVLPLLMVLGVTGTMRQDTIAALIGTVIGFVLSGFSKE